MFALFTVIYGALGYGHFYRRYVIEDRARWGDQPPYRAVGRWLRNNVPAGSHIYCPSWSVSSFLWYQAPQLSFPCFLDPIFMRIASHGRFFSVHKKILGGQVTGNRLLQAIETVFGAKVAVIPPRFYFLNDRFEEAGLKPVFIGPQGTHIYRLSQPRNASEKAMRSPPPGLK
ncbi:MAG: hypothetical protein D6820_17210 [Lentisphaerae bacterium]|nr:MAG: hypothetical protein D6820_17210 [Lentisphaerota bacterium]